MDSSTSQNIFDVYDFGAKGDGKILDTQAVQSAINAANQAGGGRVVFHIGRFLCGTFDLKSDVELHLVKDAVLLGSVNRDDYRMGSMHSLILANGQKNIAITGEGTIDGQGRELAQDVVTKWKAGLYGPPTHPAWRPGEGLRPQLIEFTSCKNVLIEDVMLKDASCWVQTYDRCEDLTIRRVTVRSTAYWNNDGIDIVDCTNALVEDCDVDAADDGICLKSHHAGCCCDNVTVRNCRVRSSASAVKFGTASYGGFRNVVVNNIEVFDTFRSAIALEIVDGGHLENVHVKGIRARNTGNAIFMRLGHRNVDGEVGLFKNVVIEDMDVYIPEGKPDKGYEIEGPPEPDVTNVVPSCIVGLPSHPIKDVTLRNITLTYEGGGSRVVAEVPLDDLDRVPQSPAMYPEFSMFTELPAWALFVRDVEGLKMENVRIRFEKHDYRAAMVFDQVQGLSLEQIHVESAGEEPILVFRNAPGASLINCPEPKGAKEFMRVIR
jgi:hypothetical protein